MSIDKKTKSIKSKLEELKKSDRRYSIFGASSHKYKLNNVLSHSAIVDFESKFKIKLPKEYSSFLMHIGNGGSGPYYGLQTLEDSLYIDLDYKREGELLNPAIPFPITEPWNMEFSGNFEDEALNKAFEDEYFDSKWTTGLLRICNYGCGVSINLVVNGDEYGNIWVDDRGNDGGIYPDPYFKKDGKTTFLEWYNLWLDQSLKEIRSG